MKFDVNDIVRFLISSLDDADVVESCRSGVTLE